jgi:hypothetical protein
MQPNRGTLTSILREAAAKQGLERLLPAHQTRRGDGTLISMLRRSMSVQAEGKTDLLKISFPHRDPVIAATVAYNKRAAPFVWRTRDVKG